MSSIDQSADEEDVEENPYVPGIRLSLGPVASFTRTYDSLVEEFGADITVADVTANGTQDAQSSSGSNSTVPRNGGYASGGSGYSDASGVGSDGLTEGAGAPEDADGATSGTGDSGSVEAGAGSSGGTGSDAGNAGAEPAGGGANGAGAGTASVSSYREDGRFLNNLVVEDLAEEPLDPEPSDPVIMTMVAQFFNDTDREQRVSCRAAFILVDVNGNMMRNVRVNQDVALEAAGEGSLQKEVSLSAEDFDLLGGIAFTCVCYDGEDVRIISRLEPQSLDGAKQDYADHEAMRSDAYYVDAWRAQYPIDRFSDTLIIGDSLVQNASAVIKSALPGVTVNADGGRSLESGGVVFENLSEDKGILDYMRKDDGSYGRYVIGAGNNDVEGMPEAAAEEIVECLGADKEIYFITEIVSDNPEGTSVTNSSIEEMVKRYPNVHVIDWHGLVEGHESTYLVDGCHVRPSHITDYVACIKKGLAIVY